MHGPRLFSRTHLVALAALMLLPACSPRKPIPSDPPEVRTEAMVRGAVRRAAQQADAPQPVAEAVQPEAAAKDDVVVAQISAPEAKSADTAQAERAPAAAKATEPKADAAKSPKVEPTAAVAAQPEAKPAVEKAAEAHPTAAAKPVEATKEATPEVKAQQPKETSKSATVVLKDAPKPEPSAAAQADAPVQTEAAQAEAAQASIDQSVGAVSKAQVVQIASFSTEKNAEAALARLKEKGYAEARVVRVEQGQAVYHRVQAGPFQDPAAARKALEELKTDWPQAFIPAD